MSKPWSVCSARLRRCLSRHSSIKRALLGAAEEKRSCQNTGDFSDKEALFSKPSPQHLSQWMSDCLRERSVTTETKKWLSAQLAHHTGGGRWLTSHITQDESGTLTPGCINILLSTDQRIDNYCRLCRHKTTACDLVTIRQPSLTQKQIRNFPLLVFYSVRSNDK